MTRFAQPFETFTEPARQRAEIWRTVLGIVMILGFAAGVIALGLFTAGIVLGSEVILQTVAELEGGGGDKSIFVLLSFFAAFWPALWLTLRLLNRRKFRTLFGPSGFVVSEFAFGFLIIAGFGILTLGLTLPFFPVQQNLELSAWLRMLPLGLVLIFFQSSAEELFFRGYLQQQLAARFQSPLIWMLVPSILFGLGHMAPEYGANNLLVVAVLTISGLIAADVTRRTGGLSLAIGLHVANNILAILIIGFDTPMGSASLWVDPTPLSDTTAIRANLLVTLAGMLVTYGVALWIARRFLPTPATPS